MQLITPNSTIYQSDSNNVFQLNKVDWAYSSKKGMNYQNERLDIAIHINLKHKGELPAGNYEVLVYCEGTLIGTDRFSLK